MVVLTCAPSALCPRDSPSWIAWRWRFAYARGFIRATFHWRLNPEG